MESYTQTALKRFNYLLTEIESTYHETTLRLGLSDGEMTVLYAVCNHGGTCMLSDIVRLSGVSKQTINSALRKLEGEGLVISEAAGGRKKRITLTERGQARAGGTAGRLIAMENEIYSQWDPGELALYLELTQRYLDALKQKITELCV